MSAEFYQEYIENNRAIIYKICRAYAADAETFDDYFQEVCYQLWKSRERYNAASCTLSTWIYRVCLNTCLTLVRRDRKEPSKVQVKEYDLTEDPNDASEKEQLAMLYRAIRQLKEAERAIIILYLEENSYQEISEILDMSLSHVGVKISRIKSKLSQLMLHELN